LTIGTGLGAGIIIDNKLYSGTNCGAGEFGVIPYKDSILEHYCSGQFFEKTHGSKGHEIFVKAKEEDESALEIFTQFGANLGEAMTIIMLALDPEAIILGGSVSSAFPFFERPMRKKMSAFPHKNALQHLTIEVTDEPHIAILGAAVLRYYTQF
jgi:glucokinase